MESNKKVKLAVAISAVIVIVAVVVIAPFYEKFQQADKVIKKVEVIASKAEAAVDIVAEKAEDINTTAILMKIEAEQEVLRLKAQSATNEVKALAARYKNKYKITVEEK